MDFFKGKLIAKVGAEAIFGIGIAPGIISKKGTAIYKFNFLKPIGTIILIWVE